MALEACKTQAWKTLRTSLENSSIATAGVPPDDLGNRPDHSTLHPLESLPDDSGNKTFNVLQTASEKPEQRQVQNTLENRTPNSSKLLGALPPDSKGVGGYISYMHPRPGILIRRPPHRGWLTMGHSSFGLNIMVGKPAVRCLSSMRMWRYASFHQSPSPARYRFQQSRWGEAGLAFFQENAAKWRAHEDATCVVDSCWFSELLFLQVLVWGLQPTQECSVGKGNPLIKTQKSQTFICF